MTDNEMDELKNRVERAHRAVPGAYEPRVDVWQRAKNLANPEPSREEVMMNMAQTLSAPTTPLPRLIETRNGFLSRFTSVAATLAVVALLAFGGWFAAMNLPPGSNGSHLAMAPGTPVASASCDVEPMTVDEVMVIAENPYAYISSDMYPEKTRDRTNSRDALRDVYPTIGISINPGYGDIPTQTAMNDALKVLDSFMACMQEHGTVAYMLRFSDPFSIQDQVRRQFPVYRDESEVRQYIDSWLRSISLYSNATAVFDGVELAFVPNRDRNNATRYLIELGLGFDQVLYIGSDVIGEDGELYTVLPVWHVKVTNVEKRPGMIFTLVHSRYSNQWYVVTGSWLSEVMLE